jgi:hypothetical protein
MKTETIDTTESGLPLAAAPLFGIGDRVRLARSYISTSSPPNQAGMQTKTGTVVRISKHRQPVVLWDGNKQAVEYGPCCIESLPNAKDHATDGARDENQPEKSK